VEAGVEECIRSGNTCLVEWPERAEELFDEETIHVVIDPVDSNHRRIRVFPNERISSFSIAEQL
jgi:tRNA threonylcarbamoyladenosine biosynthesis protein TsaE